MKEIPMKVVNQLIVPTTFGFEIVFECENEKYFTTSHGGFGQRDMYVIEISKEEFKKLVN